MNLFCSFSIVKGKITGTQLSDAIVFEEKDDLNSAFERAAMRSSDHQHGDGSL